MLDILYSRRSIRRFKPDPVPKEVLIKILEAGRLAPSSCNLQPYHFVVITDKKIMQELSTPLNPYNFFIKDSAIVIVGCAFIGDEHAKRCAPIDLTIALENMVIAAWSLEVGSCWCGSFNEDKVKKLLGIPENYCVKESIICLGYPDEKPAMPKKRELDEFFSINKFKHKINDETLKINTSPYRYRSQKLNY